MGKRFRYLSSQHAFTLVELLIVIAILGILGGGIIAAINPLAKINSANLAKAKTFAASVENNLAIDQVGKWSFEDGAGATSFKDTSGYNASGSCSGSTCPTWKNATDCGLGLGGCLSFDGGDYINFNNNAILDAGDFAWAAWIKFTTLPANNQNMAIVLDWTGAGGKTFHVQRDGSGTLGFWAQARTILPSITTLQILPGNGAYNFQTGQWYFVVFQYDGTYLKTFANGALHVTQNVGTYTLQTNSGTAQIGSAWGTDRFFNGIIDEVAIYSQSLNLSQIQQLYAQGLPKHQLVRQVDQ